MSQLPPVLKFESLFEVQDTENQQPNMGSCNPEICQHFYALNSINENFVTIQNENFSLKKEIESLKSGQQQSAKLVKNNQVYYRFLLEMNKENQDLCSQLLDSKRVVAELQPKLEQVLRSITNIEHTIQQKNKKLEELTAEEENVLIKPESRNALVVANIENMPVEVQMQELPELPERAEDNILITPESQNPAVMADIGNAVIEPQVIVKTEEEENNYPVVIEIDSDNATEEDEDSYVQNTSEMASTSEHQLVAADGESIATTSQDAAPFLMMPSNLCYQELLAECSMCHVPFAQYNTQDPKASSSSPLCDKCKELPLSSIFQFPNPSSGIVSRGRRMRLASVIPHSELSNKQDKSATGKKMFTCPTCGKQCTQSSGLTKHIRIHTGERPFVCEVCGRGFPASDKLTRHFQIHTGKKSKYSENQFPNSLMLVKHARAHIGEKPFSCEICGKNFTTSDNLAQHIQTHTD